MSKPKQIAFRPTAIDYALLQKMLETGKYKDNTSLMRAAIQQLALVSLEPEEYTNTIADAYENDVFK